MASSPMETENPGTEGGQDRTERGASPCKKQKGEEPGGLTLDMIREAMRAELGKSRDELGASIASVREEVAFFSKRVDSIEAGVTRQMDTTNKMLTLVTGNHDKQQEALENIRAKQDAQAASMKAFQGGLSLLEGKLKGSSLTGGSTADTEAPKKPALIIGGWPEDQPAAETLKKAQDILRQLDVPLDFSEMFVPGLKRGYAIVPIPQRWGETDDQRREIVQSTLQKVRRANVMLGVNPAGHQKLWMSLSQSPERRRKARLAGKVKRAMLELGAKLGLLEVEFSTGSVWYNQQRLSSATLEMPKQAERAGAGWVKLDKMAQALGKTLQEVQAAWQPRKEELR